MWLEDFLVPVDSHLIISLGAVPDFFLGEQARCKPTGLIKSLEECNHVSPEWSAHSWWW
jgi:hypothetical protein